MADITQELIKENKRRFNRTEELVARSYAVWDELDHIIKATPYSIDQWAEIAKKKEGPEGLFFSAHLEVVKSHLNLAKNRKRFERPRLAHLNTIPPSRLIQRV